MKRSSMVARIPEDMRYQLQADPFMLRCIINEDCEGRIQWHHAFKYAGKRINELWAILPMCEKHHIQEARFSYIITDTIRERVAYFNAWEDAAEKYTKSYLFEVDINTLRRILHEPCDTLGQ